jgi:PBP1b-binding outer membrane lipoprotein LpoB
MKKFAFAAFTIALLAACGSDPKPTQQEQKAVEQQVEKDQAAMDSMEKVIQQQIEAVSEDSIVKENSKGH